MEKNEYMYLDNQVILLHIFIDGEDAERKSIEKEKARHQVLISPSNFCHLFSSQLPCSSMLESL